MTKEKVRAVKRCAFCTAVCKPRSYTTHIVCGDCRQVQIFNAWAERHGLDLTTIDDDYHLELMGSKVKRDLVVRHARRRAQAA